MIDGWSSDWSRFAVYSAGTVWDGNRFPDQHVAERLARHIPVLYVDPPLSLLSPLRDKSVARSLEGPRLRLVNPRLARLTPVVLPGMQRRFVRASTIALLRRAIRRAAGSIGGTVEAVIAATPLPVFGICGEPRRVYFATDDFVAASSFTSGDERWLQRREDAQLAEADTIIVVSDVLAKKYGDLGKTPIIIPNGVDDVIFSDVDDAVTPSDVRLPPPIVGFVGHLSERIDVALLEAVAATGRSLLLVGPRQITFDLRRVESLMSRPNVQWVGAKPFTELPSYLRVIDVGLVPYVDDAFNRASFPLKTLEYLASGRAAVATDLPAIRAIASPLIEIASGSTAFVEAVERAVAIPRTPELMDRRRAVARAHSWDRRTVEFAQALRL